jgi:predicted esterase
MAKKKTKKEVPVIGGKFITNDELTSVKAAVEAVNRLQMQVGGIELQKHDLMHTMKMKTDVLEAVQKTLEEKYGDVSIDIVTGEMKDNAPSTKN